MNINDILKKILEIPDLVTKKHTHSNKSTLDKITESSLTTWYDKYTKNEIDNKISQVITDLDWKESVAMFSNLSTTYPNPDDGWTVNVKDTDITYRWSGTAWIAISANSIPLATSSTDGKMSKQDKIDHDDMNSKKHTHDNKSIIDIITQAIVDNWNEAYTHISDSIKHITSSERTNWNDANSKKHEHSNKSILDGVTSTLISNWNSAFTHVSDAVKHITSAERTLWNTVSNKVDKVTGKDLSSNDFTSAYKSKLDGISTDSNKTEQSSTNGNIKIDGVEKTVYTHPAGSNPHGTTKSDVGLGNVDNTNDLNKPISTATKNALDGKSNISHSHNTLSYISLTDATTDLNSLNCSTGSPELVLYRCATTGGSSGILNKPTDDGPFTLLVQNIRYISTTDYVTRQLFTSVTTSISYERFCNTGVWSSWNSIYTTKNKPTKADVGLGGVDNTSDVNKPVSTAMQTALNGKANSSHTHTKANITDMPTKLSQFTNDSGYITQSDVDISQNHTHSNKTILDNITQSLINNWNSAFTHISDTIKHITAAERTLWNTVSNKLDKSGGTVTGKITIQGTAASNPLNVRGINGVSTEGDTDDVLYLNYNNTNPVYINGNNAVYHAGNKPSKTDVGLSNVDNTSDLNKPISTAAQTALNGKANSSHSHTKSQITDFPASLKNPTALTVQLNGITNKTYDGSSEQTVNITPSAIGASETSHIHDDRYYTESEIDSKVSSLNTSINGKANSSHTHDDRYYTESEVNTKLNTKVDKGMTWNDLEGV